MINTQKAILVYNKTTTLNLNSLDSTVKSKIEQIARIDPITGNAFQVWAPNAQGGAVTNFAAVTCGNVYIIETLPGVSLPYQLSNDGSDDGFRLVNDYNKLICSGGFTPTPTPTPTLTPTPTPTPTLTPTPTPTPVAPYALFIAVDPNTQVPNLYDSAGGFLPIQNPQRNNIKGSFSSYCQYSELRYNMRNDNSFSATDTFSSVTVAIKYQGVLVGVAIFERQYYASIDGGNDGVSITYTCGCSVYTGKLTKTYNAPEAEIPLLLVTDQCPPTPTPTPTKTPTPTPTSTLNTINLTAANPILTLGYECIPAVQCPPGSDDPEYCCGQSNKIHYNVESGLLSYTSTSINSTLTMDVVSAGNVEPLPILCKFKIGNNYYGEIAMLTNRYIGRPFQINDGCTIHTGTITSGNDIILNSQTIC